MDTAPQSAFDRYYEQVKGLLKDPDTDRETKREILLALQAMLDREAK